MHLEHTQHHQMPRLQRQQAFSRGSIHKHLFRNLGALHEEIVSLAWQPLPSRVFAVPHPKPREVWAAQFRDRVVHHWVVGRLSPRWVPRLIETTYACLEGRGTHQAIRDATQSAARITQHWSREGWWLKFDIANFFGSIHLPTLWQMVEPTLADPWERRVLHQVLFCQQRNRPIVQDKSNTLHLVPPHKSLLAAPEDRGLPIGNLTSQFLANVYLHGMDETGELLAGKKRYLRYADDVLLLGGDLDALRDTMRQCEQAAADVRLAIHPGKTCFGRLHQGFDFVGFFALPGRLRLRRSTYAQHLRALRDPKATRQQRASRLGAIRFCSTA